MNTEINLIAKNLAKSKHTALIGGTQTNGVDDNAHFLNGIDEPVSKINDFHVRKYFLMCPLN